MDNVIVYSIYMDNVVVVITMIIINEATFTLSLYTIIDSDPF